MLMLHHLREKPISQIFQWHIMCTTIPSVGVAWIPTDTIGLASCATTAMLPSLWDLLVAGAEWVSSGGTVAESSPSESTAMFVCDVVVAAALPPLTLSSSALDVWFCPALVLLSENASASRTSATVRFCFSSSRAALRIRNASSAVGTVLFQYSRSLVAASL